MPCSPRSCCEAGCFLGPTDEPPDLDVFTHFQTHRHPQAVEFSVVLMHPQSRGAVAVDPADPWGTPWIDPRILEHTEDRKAVQAGVERVRSIVAQPALRRFGLGREILPGYLDPDTHLRDHATSYHHPIGTCRMGDDVLAVVDSNLRVRGTDNLWVADNSVVPTIPAGHTAGTAVIIGEKAAELVSAEASEGGGAQHIEIRTEGRSTDGQRIGPAHHRLGQRRLERSTPAGMEDNGQLERLLDTPCVPLEAIDRGFRRKPAATEREPPHVDPQGSGPRPGAVAHRADECGQGMVSSVVHQGSVPYRRGNRRISISGMSCRHVIEG